MTDAEKYDSIKTNMFDGMANVPFELTENDVMAALAGTLAEVCRNLRVPEEQVLESFRKTVELVYSSDTFNNNLQ